MLNKKTVYDIDLKNKTVLLKVDYNVSLFPNFQIADDTRIQQTIPTIKYLLQQNCKIILVSHLGRPKGEVRADLTLKHVLPHLKKVFNQDVEFVKDFRDKNLQKKLKLAPAKSIFLLENIRFYPEEQENDHLFSKELARLAEIFVNDAFGVAHRAHASNVGVTEFLPAVSGILLSKEISIIGGAIKQPGHPLVAIIGGAKAVDKITLIDKLLEKADVLIVGGGCANTFLKAWGYKTGKSKVETSMVEIARQLIWKASRSNTKLLLPTDVVLGKLATNYHNGAVSVDKIPKDLQALDIGPKTQAEFGKAILQAQTIIWNGPMGVYENPSFCMGTDFIYHAITQNDQALAIVGGGDTITAIKKQEYIPKIDHLSTGGGAMLEYIEKGTLPAIEALTNL